MKWKYQERIDTSLTGQPFIGKVGKTRKGEMLMPIHASVSSVLQQLRYETDHKNK